MTDLLNLSVLREKNSALLQKINFDPTRDDPFELDNRDTFRSTGLFPDEALDCIFDGTEAREPPANGEKIPSAIGMLLVRPDMVHIASKVESFIEQRFELLDVATTIVTPQIYWQMYGDAITSRETRQSRLTRAAVYIGSPCRLFVFEQPDKAYVRDMPVADYAFTHLKGRQGIEERGTLRGDLVYKGALEVGFHTLTNPLAALAADPFGAYRKIVESSTDSPCLKLVHPLLFFTGVGIHIPDYAEMQRDLTIVTQQDNRREHATAA